MILIVFLYVLSTTIAGNTYRLQNIYRGSYDNPGKFYSNSIWTCFTTLDSLFCWELQKPGQLVRILAISLPGNIWVKDVVIVPSEPKKNVKSEPADQIRINGSSPSSSVDIWMASQDGLLKYSGQRWQIYQEVSADYLEAGNNGELWMVANGTLLKYINGKFDQVVSDQIWQTLAFGVNCLQIDRQDFPWIGKMGPGIARFNGGELDINEGVPSGPHIDDPGWEDSAPRALCFDSDNNLWVDYPLGAACWKNNTWVEHDLTGYGFESGVSSLAADDSGTIWASDGGRRVICFDGTGWYEPELQGLDLSRGNQWIAQMTAGPGGSMLFVLASESPACMKGYIYQPEEVLSPSPVMVFDTVLTDPSVPTPRYVAFPFKKGNQAGFVRKDLDSGIAVFSMSDFSSTGLAPAELNRVELWDAGGKTVGHMTVNWNEHSRIKGIFMVSGPHVAEDANWEYYSPGEHMVSLLIQPEEIHQDRNPLVLVHGMGGYYPYFNEPFISQLNANPEHVNMFDIWRFYYPYDQQIEQSAPLLGKALEQIQAYEYTPNDGRVNILAHSMGGLVTRALIQNVNPDYTYQNNIEKFCMLGTPNHGSHSAFRISHPESYLLSAGINFFGNIQDESSPAVYEMYPGSEFLTRLNMSAPNPLHKDSTLEDYLVIAGTKNPFGLLEAEACLPDNDDFVVAVPSASLLDFGIPLATVNNHHQGLYGSGLLLDQTVLDPGFIAMFFADGYNSDSPGFGDAVQQYWTSPPDSSPVPLSSIVNVHIEGVNLANSMSVAVDQVNRVFAIHLGIYDQLAGETIPQGLAHNLVVCGTSPDFPVTYTFMENEPLANFSPWDNDLTDRKYLACSLAPGTYRVELYNADNDLVWANENYLAVHKVCSASIEIILSEEEVDLIQNPGHSWAGDNKYDGFHPAINGWAKFELKGQVKHMTTYPAEAEDVVEDRQTYYFDTSGRIVRSEDMEALSGYDYKYVYDDLGRITEISESWNDYEFGTMEFITRMTYSADGVLLASYEYPTYPSETYTKKTSWDENNHKVRDDNLNSDGTIYETISYVYDDKGYLIRETTIDPSGKVLKTIEYSNDAVGHPLTVRYQDLTYGTNKITQHSYTYDRQGNILTDDDGTWKIAYKYVYY
jgi:pimeloyl-ACP methyl ester carboxylesterase